MLDDSGLAEKAGTGYQTMMNDACGKYLGGTEQPVTAELLRQVLRQEMPHTSKKLSADCASTVVKRSPLTSPGFQASLHPGYNTK